MRRETVAEKICVRERIAPAFLPVHRDIREGRYAGYWRMGGKGPAKSSFVSLEGGQGEDA